MTPMPDFRRVNERIRTRLQSGRGDAALLNECGIELQVLAADVSAAIEMEFLELTRSGNATAA
jgi:hypothetical protein